MFSATEMVGTIAAVCTTAAYVPQVHKCWTTRSAADLSLYMLIVLMGGVSLWVIYGLLRHDAVIVAANAVSTSLLASLVLFKLRDMAHRRRTGARRRAA
jgi:MtN3 and saliva related transmembrane protein